METTQSWYPFLMAVCVCVCVCFLLSKPQSPRGTNQGFMQERCMEVMCQNLGRWETKIPLLLGIFKSRDPHILDSKGNNPAL